jgi:hypothetical protein
MFSKRIKEVSSSGELSHNKPVESPNDKLGLELSINVSMVPLYPLTPF